MNRPIFPPPKGFRTSSLVYLAEFSDGPAGLRDQNHRLRGAPGRGMAYERKVHGYLQRRFAPEHEGALYAPGRWIKFQTLDPREPNVRWAQPDGFIIDLARAHITIIEIKLKHTQVAWWGLRQLYEPLFRKIFGTSWTFSVCEVVRWYDSQIFWPEPYELVRDPSRLRRNEFGVMILTEDTIKYG